MYGRCRSKTGYQIRRTLQLLNKEMEVFSHGEFAVFFIVISIQKILSNHRLDKRGIVMSGTGH